MKPSRLRRAVLALSIGYGLVVLGAFVVQALWLPDFYEVRNHIGPRCYQTDALIVYAECTGFVGASVVGFILSLPWLLFEVPLFVLSDAFYFFLPYTLLLWAPLLYLVVFVVKSRRAVRRGE